MGMFRKTQDGFSVIEAGLILAVVGSVGLIGWYILQANHTNSVSSNTAQNQTKALPRSHIFESGTVIAPYVLPSGWSSLACGTDTVNLYVPSVKAPANCKDTTGNPEDPRSPDSASMGTYIRDTTFLDTQSCANTLVIRDGGNSQYPANEYTCQDVTIGGKKGLRQVGTHTTQSFQVLGVPSVQILYDFPVGNGLMFEASYMHYTKSPFPDLTKQFDAFVNSLMFK